MDIDSFIGPNVTADNAMLSLHVQNVIMVHNLAPVERETLRIT